MPLFEQPQYFITPIKTTNYTANDGEMVLVDTTLGDVTITAPLNPSNGDVFLVKKISDDNNFIFVDGGIPDIESALDIESISGSAIIYGSGGSAEWIYDNGGSIWFNLNSNKIPPYIEVWTGNDIITLTGTQNIVFTFVPIFVGQTAQILTHSAGVFTEQITGTFNMQLSSLINYNANANNVDAGASLGFSASAQITSLRDFNAFATPRIGSFINSANSDGILNAEPAQTFSATATEEFATGNIDIDITDALLSISF